MLVSLIVFIAVYASPFALQNAVHARERYFSTLEGTTITFHPSAASLQIPLEWTKEYGAVNVTPGQLDKVRTGKGEWYKEYAAIMNAALPFSDCSAQAGTHAWDSGGFGGLQMRAYVLSSNLSDIDAKIIAKGLAAAKSVSNPSAPDASIEKGEVGPWHRIRIEYDVWYGDYGGKANVDFYVAARERQTVVLVFMYGGANSPSAMQQILQSFSWPKS